MASGEIEVTPGRVLSAEELVDNQKLNDLGNPTLRVKQQAITARELADGSIDADKLSVDLEAQLGVSDNSVTTNKIVDGAVTPNKLSADAKAPPGTVVDYAGATAPSGWLLCGGQAISRTTYAELFAAIGTVWGAGDGSTTFNVPDLRGYVCAGKDNMNGSASGRLSTAISGGGGATALGGFGGAQTHAITLAETAAHNHGVTASGSVVVAAVPYAAGGAGPFASGGAIGLGNGSYGVSVSGATDVRGSGSGHNNVQPTRMLNKIIRYL